MSTIMGFSKKQFRQLEIIVLLNALALSLVIPSATSTGEIPTPSNLFFRHGSGSCQMVYGQSINSCSVSFGTTISSNNYVPDLFNWNIAPMGFDQYLTILSPSSKAQTWANMPHGQTELFGGTQNEYFLAGWSSAINHFLMACQLIVHLNTTGSAGAHLRLQSSSDFATWVNAWPPTEALFPGSNTLDGTDVWIDSTNNTSTPVWLTGSLGQVPVDTNFQSAVRVVGIQNNVGNGGSPSFDAIFVDCVIDGQGAIQQPPATQILSTSTTGFSFTMFYPGWTDTKPSFTVTFSWYIIGCTNKANNC